MFRQKQKELLIFLANANLPEEWITVDLKYIEALLGIQGDNVLIKFVELAEDMILRGILSCMVSSGETMSVDILLNQKLINDSLVFNEVKNGNEEVLRNILSYEQENIFVQA